MELTVIRTRDIDAGLRAKIVRLCIDAHGLEDFANLFSYLPDDGLHVIASDADEIIGHAVVTTRWLHGSVGRLRTAYVDAVSTQPSLQGTGIGRAVMGHLANAITDYDIACLETDREGFYERLGWQRWRGPLGGRTPEGVISTPDQEGVMVLRLPNTPTLDLDDALAVEVDGRIW